MKTKDRNIIQITLVFLGLLLILLTYFLYPKVKERKFIEEKSIIKEESKVAGTKDNYFENVEYKGLYKINNQFVVKSEEAIISNEEPDIVNMTNMRVVIEMQDGRSIVITSDKGIYNKR